MVEIITLDAETYFDSDYTLSKLTVEDGALDWYEPARLATLRDILAGAVQEWRAYVEQMEKSDNL
jgi:hypothetical protein